MLAVGSDIDTTMYDAHLESSASSPDTWAAWARAVREIAGVDDSGEGTREREELLAGGGTPGVGAG